MSDESVISKPVTPPLLPPSEVRRKTFTYTFPSILLGIGVDANGFISKQVREGESRQIEFTTTTHWSEEPETEEVFTVKGANRLSIGALPVMVLTNAIEFPDFSLPATVPSADEYLALIGKEVCTGFLCRRDNEVTKQRGVPTYRVDRTTIVLQ